VHVAGPIEPQRIVELLSEAALGRTRRASHALYVSVAQAGGNT
jgi:hypothetical protein